MNNATRLACDKRTKLKEEKQFGYVNCMRPTGHEL